MRANHAIVRLLLAALCLWCTYACGGDDTVPVRSGSPSAGRNGGKDKDGGKDEPTDGGGGSGGKDAGPTEPVDKNAPIVEILEPAAAGDPNDDPVLIGEIIEVRCSVKKSLAPGASAVDLSKVRIAQINPDDPTHPIAGTVAAEAGGVFTAEFRLTDTPNGPLSFRCEADDMGMPVRTGRDTVETFLDLGPVIELERPTDASAHALKNPVQISFRVKDAPVASDDDESTPTGLELVVSGVPFDFTESSDEPGLYSAAVNFADTTLYPMPPTTAEVVVTAKSSRSPEAPTRRAKADITIDSKGPKITVQTPGQGVIVRSDVTLTVMITDDSGVDQDTVIGTIALLNGEEYVLSDWKVAGNVYTETFDTRSFDPTLTQLTINVVAKDLVGNESDPATLLIRIDNVAPILSLDPPKLREYTKPTPTTRVCSEPFDPVGPDAVSDLDVVEATAMYRVMVEERTNLAPGQEYGYAAGIEPDTMKLYARRDLSIPLLIDTDGDAQKICDEINFDALPVGQRPIALDLAPVIVRGAAEYRVAFNPNDPENIAPQVCMAVPMDSMPLPLCGSSPMTRIVSQRVEGAAVPAIYGRMPTNATTGECSGQQWLLPFAEGWACVAARVEDAIGNVGLSRPLRVCFDDGVGTPVCDPTNPSDTPPTCTDGCTYPDAFAPNQTWEFK